jgi:hypothetical protein
MASGASDGWGDDNWEVEDEGGGVGWGEVDDLDLGADDDVYEDDNNDNKKGSGRVGTLGASASTSISGSSSSSSSSTSSKGKLEVPVESVMPKIGGLTLSKSAKAAKPVVKKISGDVDWDDF